MFQSGKVQRELQKAKKVDDKRKANTPFHVKDHESERLAQKESREGDPMADFIKKEKKKSDTPKYRGPAPPPNRYNIVPGYRWDGVDRGNGFEQRLMQRENQKQSYEAEGYRYSTADM